MFYLVLALVSVLVLYVAHRRAARPRYMEQRRSMATRVVRPYAIVEAYDADGNAVLPTIVYDADQLDLATERYAMLGCSVVVGTLVDTAETSFGAGAASVH